MRELQNIFFIFFSFINEPIFWDLYIFTPIISLSHNSGESSIKPDKKISIISRNI